MKMFLASMENQQNLLAKVNHINYALISYFYLNKNSDKLKAVLEKTDELLIDSGAHSFQHGVKVDFDEFVSNYKEFIKANTDNPKIIGFFEMDIDNVVGYDKVKEYREQLESVSNKIIPVWHSNRGIDDFIEMCKKYKGKRIAITGFVNNDIVDKQYNLFINTAHKYQCTIHILGMTRLEFIKELNLGKDDSFDSNTWLRRGIYGEIVLPKNKYGVKLFYQLHGLKDEFSYMDKINLCSFIQVQSNLKEKDQSLKAKRGYENE